MAAQLPEGLTPVTKNTVQNQYGFKTSKNFKLLNKKCLNANKIKALLLTHFSARESRKH